MPDLKIKQVTMLQVTAVPKHLLTKKRRKMLLTERDWQKVLNIKRLGGDSTERQSVPHPRSPELLVESHQMMEEVLKHPSMPSVEKNAYFWEGGCFKRY